MRRAILVELELLVLAVLVAVVSTAPLSGAALYLAGRDSDGVMLANGSGYAQGGYFRPLTFDDGRVAFIAAMPEYAGSDTLFRATYVIAPMATNPIASVLFAGRNEFAYSLGREWPLTNWALAGDRDGQSFFVLRQEQSSDLADSSIPHLRCNVNGVIGGLALDGVRLSSDARLCGSANGARLFVYERGKTAIGSYAVTSSSLTALPDLVLPAGADGFPAYDGRGIATNYNGRTVYFAGTGRGEGVGIFSYELSSARLGEIALGVCPLSTDAEVAVAATNGVVAFRSMISSLADVLSTGTGSQLYAAVPDAENEGVYHYQLCSKDLHDANAPQLSYDGRYVVFCAKATPDGIQQVWRFDRLTGEQRPVSMTGTAWADQDCLVPAISPNGRYTAFVSSATNLGVAGVTQPLAWLADVGPTLTVGNLVQTPERKALLLAVDGALSSAMMVLRVAPGTPVPAGTFSDSNGSLITIGTFYTLAERPLPWSYTASAAEAGRTYEMQVQLSDSQYSSEFRPFSITVNDSVIDVLSLAADGEFWSGVADYYSLSMSADGSRVAFVTDANLLAETVQAVNSRVYLRDIVFAKTYSVSMPTGKNSYNGCISGDGRTVYFVTSDGLLYAYQVTTGSRELIAGDVDSYAPLAVSHAGDVLLYERGGGLVLRHSGAESSLPLPAGAVDVINPSLSRDGQTAIFLARTADIPSYSLYAYFSSMPDRAVLLLEDVASASMSMSGATALVQQGDGQGGTVCKRIAVGGTDRQERLLAIAMATNSSPVLSGNGRIAAYVRLGENDYNQACSYDFSVGRERIASVINGVLGDAHSDSGVALVMSTRGDSLAFVSAAGNLAVGDDNDANDLFRVAVPMLAQQAPVLTTLDGQTVPEDRVFTLTTDEDVPLFLPMVYNDADGDDALPELLTAPLYGSSEFIGPDAQRAWYAIRYTPAANYFGAETFVFRLWDGYDRSAGYAVAVTVNSVNDLPYWRADIPAALTSYSLTEGATFQSEPLRAYADDADLRNPEPHADALSFSLSEDAPSWVTMDSATGKVSFTPGFDVVQRTQSEAERTFHFGCLVKDQADATARLDIKVTVENVNRPPEISRFPALVVEGVEVPHTAFVVSDPDAEDPLESLLLEFTVEAGEWILSSTGRTFVAAPSAVNDTRCTVQARDSAGMRSEAKIIRIYLTTMQQSMLSLWPCGGAVGSALQAGWQLLAMPYTLDALGLEQLFTALGPGAAIWRWDNARGFYVVATSLQAGEGFWCYLPVVPEDLSWTIDGSRETEPRTFAAGWQLVGLRNDETALWLGSEEPVGSTRFLWRLASGQHFSPQPSKGPFMPGRGYWLFHNGN